MKQVDFLSSGIFTTKSNSPDTYRINTVIEAIFRSLPGVYTGMIKRSNMLTDRICRKIAFLSQLGWKSLCVQCQHTRINSSPRSQWERIVVICEYCYEKKNHGGCLKKPSSLVNLCARMFPGAKWWWFFPHGFVRELQGTSANAALTVAALVIKWRECCFLWNMPLCRMLVECARRITREVVIERRQSGPHNARIQTL